MTDDALGSAGFRPAGADESARANRDWWDREADDYLAEHGDFLADRLVWGPEGLDESAARLLGEVRGRSVLEVGAGAAQCARWLAGQGARVTGTDQSAGMLRRSRTPGAAAELRRSRTPGAAAELRRSRTPGAAAELRRSRTPGAAAELRRSRTPGAAAELRRSRTPGAAGRPGLVQCDARALPFPDGCFDLAFSSYGAIPFVADPERVMAEVARVLRPGGRWVFSIGHPIRWAFPDDPGRPGLIASRSYFDPTPYVETGTDGVVRYAEHHRTLGHRIADLVGAGFVLDQLVEPTWPPEHDQVWGGWSPLRGRLLPGTAIFVSHRAG
jgi:SAM-dependent methyltransferase